MAGKNTDGRCVWTSQKLATGAPLILGSSDVQFTDVGFTDVNACHSASGRIARVRVRPRSSRMPNMNRSLPGREYDQPAKPLATRQGGLSQPSEAL